MIDSNEQHPFAGLTASQRAALAAEVWTAGPVSPEKILDSGRKAWIALQRRDFIPGKPGPCYACGLSDPSNHSHHVYPLYLQFNGGMRTANHEFVWLCAAHHERIHRAIEDKCYRARRLDDLQQCEQRRIKLLLDRYRELRWQR